MIDFTQPTRDTVNVIARNATAQRMHGEDWEQCAEGSEVVGGFGIRRVFHGPDAARLAAHDLEVTHGH